MIKQKINIVNNIDSDWLPYKMECAPIYAFQKNSTFCVWINNDFIFTKRKKSNKPPWGFIYSCFYKKWWIYFYCQKRRKLVLWFGHRKHYTGQIWDMLYLSMTFCALSSMLSITFINIKCVTWCWYTSTTYASIMSLQHGKVY